MAAWAIAPPGLCGGAGVSCARETSLSPLRGPGSPRRSFVIRDVETDAPVRPPRTSKLCSPDFFESAFEPGPALPSVDANLAPMRTIARRRAESFEHINTVMTGHAVDSDQTLRHHSPSESSVGQRSPRRRFVVEDVGGCAGKDASMPGCDIDYEKLRKAWRSESVGGSVSLGALKLQSTLEDDHEAVSPPVGEPDLKAILSSLDAFDKIVPVGTPSPVLGRPASTGSSCRSPRRHFIVEDMDPRQQSAICAPAAGNCRQGTAATSEQLCNQASRLAHARKSIRSSFKLQSPLPGTNHQLAKSLPSSPMSPFPGGVNTCNKSPLSPQTHTAPTTPKTTEWALEADAFALNNVEDLRAAIMLLQGRVQQLKHASP